MARQLKKKELIHTALANNYGGWIYCENCNKNIGYLCYVTYDSFTFHYECNCGSKGMIMIEVENGKVGKKSTDNLITIKNRFCCPNDNSPLITVLNKNLKQYKFEITCSDCGVNYQNKGSISNN